MLATTRITAEIDAHRYTGFETGLMPPLLAVAVPVLVSVPVIVALENVRVPAPLMVVLTPAAPDASVNVIMGVGTTAMLEAPGEELL